MGGPWPRISSGLRRKEGQEPQGRRQFPLGKRRDLLGGEYGRPLGSRLTRWEEPSFSSRQSKKKLMRWKAEDLFLDFPPAEIARLQGVSFSSFLAGDCARGCLAGGRRRCWTFGYHQSPSSTFVGSSGGNLGIPRVLCACGVGCGGGGF